MESRHWKWYFFVKTLKGIVGHTSESTGYNQMDNIAVVTGKKLLDCIIHGAGISGNIFLKDCVCAPFMTIRRSLDLFTPNSDKFQDAITSQITKCVNKKYRELGNPSWLNEIETLLESSESLRLSMNSPLRIQIDETLQQLLNALNLNNEELTIISDISQSNRGLNLSTVRAIASYNQLNENCRRFLTEIVIAVNIRTNAQINIPQTEVAAQQLFKNDNSFMEYVNNSMEYINLMTFDKIN
eukprot:67650_1